ncbi:hypothetical protein [Paenibacillus sp. OV219]|uniref:hypothetical protein n=1 Tax=Paenibacillus sp. OV219 TaxID=1884377 RepID=UPI0008B21F25|nr:hypothetical protein [Paenibacillus sp. OV219]SEN97535.1 hypothetical protein SAMN05518847_105129 [Paenibacillus sp. OV219]
MNGEPPKPQSWWQTLPGILTAMAGIITAVTGLTIALTQAGVFSIGEKHVSSSTETKTITSPVETSEPTTVGNSNQVGELEQKLHGVNIELGPTAVDAKKVRGYLAGTNKAYRLLAASCLQILDNQRLKEVGYLDVIDDQYTRLVGELNYASADGKLNVEKLKEAMVNAQNEIHGAEATTYDQIVESH